MLIYDKGIGEYKDWILCEGQFDSKHQGKCESIMTLGNGYLGLRAALEESYVGQTRNLFVAGTFNRFHPDEVTELPNAADIAEFQIHLNSEPFTLDCGDVLEYSRYLNLKEGELVRDILWRSPKGETFRLQFRRFVSLEDLHTIAFKIEIVPLTCDAHITIKTGIDGRMTNSGSQHFREGDKQVYDRNYMQLVQTTTESDIDFVLNSCCLGSMMEEAEFGVERRRIYGTYELYGQKDSKVCFEKLANIFTSRDKESSGKDIEDLKTSSLKHLQKASKLGYNGLFAASKVKWADYWSEVNIELDSENHEDLLAVRFAQYHLLIMTPIHDCRYNIGAKGLSGEGYKGHVFWDTEIFMLPYFQYNMPQAARQLLLYRYNTLDGARNKAVKFGYKGAMYPWETAFSGEEETPEWAALNIMTGKPTRVWAGLKEHHITADIAYAVWQYYLTTNDVDFMERYGYEMIFECAWFWCSRVYWNAERDRFEIRDVIGPDEYTEHIDNNAYTNYMAHYVVSLALSIYEELQGKNKALLHELNMRLDLSNRYETYRLVSRKLYLPAPNAEGILPQDDTFLSKGEIDISKYRTNNLKQSILLDYSRSQVIDLQVLKQADVVMLFHTLRKLFDIDIIKKGWSYYESRTIHDSSLSCAVHGLVAAYSGNKEAAYSFFKEASMIDMGQNPISSNAGIHAASMGGIWMMVVLGFGGVYHDEGVLELNPMLPDVWSKLSFNIIWQSKKLHIEITKNETIVSADRATPCKIRVRGKEYELGNKLIVKHEVDGNE